MPEKGNRETHHRGERHIQTERKSKKSEKQPHPHLLQLPLPSVIRISKHLLVPHIISISAITLSSWIISICDKIHLINPHPPRTFQEFPPNKHHQHNGQFDIITYKIHRFKYGAETLPTLNENEENIENYRDHGAVGIGEVFEGEEMF